MRTIILVLILTINTMNMEAKQKVIYLAGGCFWGTEHFLKQINGVKNTAVGYANSNVKNPTYEEVCTGKTNAAETVKVVYDDKKIDLGTILELFFLTIDPTLLNRQGNDIGTQYRTGVYFVDREDKETIDKFIKEEQQKVKSPIVVEVMELKNFYEAEEYHQDYLEKKPGGYCHLHPRLFEVAKRANRKNEGEK